jgi:hypothetical protein
MGKFFNDKNLLAGFEDYIGDRQKKYRSSLNDKEFENVKIYNFLEYNYYRLKKLAKLLHKKIYNLGSDEYFDSVYREYEVEIKSKRKELIEILSGQDHPFQKKQESIYHYFFTRK